jgi:hypothetical protein
VRWFCCTLLQCWIEWIFGSWFLLYLVTSFSLHKSESFVNALFIWEDIVGYGRLVIVCWCPVQIIKSPEKGVAGFT